MGTQGSTSKISTYRRCKRKFYYNDILKLQHKCQSILPVRGTILHECLSNLYTGKDWATPIRDLKIEWDKLFDEEREEWGNLPDELYRIMRGYILAYRSLDAGIKTLAVERQFALPVKGGHTYNGTIDWVYEDKDGVWIADHKTTKAIPPVNELYMDLQTLIYFEAVKQGCVEGVTPDNLAGIVFNHIKTKPPSKPRILKNGTVSKAQCDTDVATYFEAVKNAGQDPKDYEDMLDKLKDNEFFKRRKIPVSPKSIQILIDEAEVTLGEIEIHRNHKEKPTIFTRNMMKNRCSWDCEFYKLCFSELAGNNTQPIIEEYYERRERRYDDQED